MSDVDSDLEEIPEFSTSPGGHRVQEHSNTASLNDIGHDDDRRAHHNALERKRRDHIKDSFSTLREVVPTLKGEKASRALILKKGSEYIHKMKTQINEHNKDIMELKRQNHLLETQVKIIESRLEATGQIRPSAVRLSTEIVRVDDHQTYGQKRDAGSSSAPGGSGEPDSKRVKSTPPQ